MVALIVASLSRELFPAVAPGLSGGTYLAMAVVTAFAFFVCLLLHELGHAFRALDEGLEIAGITLWLFGGVAKMRSSFPSAGAEFRIAIAGPLVTAVLAVVLWGAALAGDAAGLPGPAVVVLEYLARINVLLLGFNLVPALPLDGGRVLRAWLWHRQRSFRAATKSASLAGRVFGGLLAAVGLMGLLAGGATGGGWLIFLGWFLYRAAQAEGSSVVVREAFERLTVSDLMTERPVCMERSMSVEGFFDEAARSGSHPVYPVVDDGRAVGAISIARAGAVPVEERSVTLVGDVMEPVDRFPVTTGDAPATEVLETLQSEPRRMLVLEDGRVAGILSISDALRRVQVEEARGEPDDAPARAGVGVWIVVAVSMALALGYIYHPPLVVLRPGPALDVTEGLTIRGTKTTPINGRYLLTSVTLEQPNALGVAMAWLDPDRATVPLSQVLPADADAERYGRQQLRLFRQSRIVAAGAAARAMGLPVSLTGTGAVVQSVMPESPASETLRPGDVITEVDGRPVDLASDLQGTIAGRPPGTTFAVEVERGPVTAVHRIPSAPARTEGDPPVIGVFVSTRALDLDLPFEIAFEDDRSIGGPSAGLAYALAIADLLDDADLAAGRTIATTGTIDLAGRVGPIGGLEGKIAGAEGAEVDLFLGPTSQVGRIEAEGFEVTGVESLRDALRVLRSSA